MPRVTQGEIWTTVPVRAGLSLLTRTTFKGLNAQIHKTNRLAINTLRLSAFVSSVLKTHSLPAPTQPGCLNLTFQDYRAFAA